MQCFAAEARDTGEERMLVSNPRMVEDGGEFEIVEEFWKVAGIYVKGQALWSVIKK